MSDLYDVLITGAGPAGCAAAYDLAQAGRRVLLLDRRSFPRHKACACGLTRKTLKALRYSVEPVIERTCHEIVLQQAKPGTDQRIADKAREVRVRARNPICAMAVRERFDAFCLQQTLAAGRSHNGSVTLLKIDAITALHELPSHITLEVATSDGPRTLRAPVLVGADGSNGQTRRLAAVLEHEHHAAIGAADEPSWYERGFALEATVPFSALPTPLPAGDRPEDLVFDFAPLPGGYGWLFPKGDHINIGVGAFAPSDRAKTAAGDRTQAEMQLKLVTRALLADYCWQKLGLRAFTDATPLHVTGQYLGMGGHCYVPHGRVLLVGDAAGLVDPLTGEGIHSAVVSGQAAAAAILGCRAKQTECFATTYARKLAPLQQTLAFSHRAARSFYRTPERGFKAMRQPVLRSLILRTYAEGLPHTRLLSALGKLV
jgi:geranylgeranyl reductase family protein